MSKIHQLAEAVIAQIAAGEVIERPAYAVKELIENALDADATIITISLENGGLRKITVTDNGIGMSEEDLLESFKPHTTSKIATEDDLNEISSFGFRGEALSSIAAISTLIIESRPANSLTGWRLIIKNGMVQEKVPTGMPHGTSVTIQNIFRDVPARKKYLKSSQTELRFIIDMVQRFALANPHVQFILINNKKIIHEFISSELQDRIQQIFSQSISEQLIPIEYQDSYISFQGFIGKPQIASTSLQKQFLFVNQRIITDKLVNQRIKQAFGNLLEATHYPFYLLSLELQPTLIDVNVHPRKEQIHFMNGDTILSQLETIIKNTLKNYDLTYQNFQLKNHKKTTKGYAANYLRENSAINPLLGKQKITEDLHIKQIHNLYLIVETAKGVTLIDQHAAHERILYQQFLKAFQSTLQTIALAKPYLMELKPSATILLQQNLEHFQKIGFTIEEFGENTFQITAVPKLLQDNNPIAIIEEMLNDIEDQGNIKEVDEQNQKMLEYLACRSAIKAGDELTAEQALELVRQLDQTENNETCPHGRPTRINISLQEMHRNFKRI